MALAQDFLDDETHPMDIVEGIAAQQKWEFDRIGEDQIAMVVEGQWRAYSITLAWSAFDETLRMICTFDLEPPQARLPQLFELLNGINDQCWAGAFAYWAEQKLMVYRYGLVLAGGLEPEAEQVETLISAAIVSAERYYPAIQLTLWGDKRPNQALEIAMMEAYGRA